VVNVKDRLLSSLPKHEPADILTRLDVLVDLDTNEMRFGAEPVDPADPLLPTAAHAGTALLVCFGNATLCFGALAQRGPLLGGYSGHERRMHRIEDVEVGQRYRRRRLALAAAFADEEARW
jgi:hypothetical protein